MQRILAVAEKYVVGPGELQGPVFDQARLREVMAVPDPEERFERIKSIIKSHPKPGFEVRKFEIEVVVGFLYPKIDFNVSATTNHLLKAPFNIHHASMSLSVPLVNIKDFDIKNCLNIDDLVEPNGKSKRKGSLGHCFEDYVREMERFCEQVRLSGPEVGDSRRNNDRF